MRLLISTTRINSAIMGKSQPVGLALCISQSILENKGAWRVHGGGFAGTIQAFVPDDLLTNYKNAYKSVFGENATYVLQIRSAGGAQIGMNRKNGMSEK